jgi:predicted transcriptional regulator of viral defense system
MRFAELLEIVGEDPLFDASVLRVGDLRERDVASQLSRWTRAGRLVRLRRGLYAVSDPFARRRVDRFVVANRLVERSYVSEESALSFHGIIPDVTFTVSSVTTGRTGVRRTPYGSFDYHHVRPSLLWGYTETPVSRSDVALVALPEKALLDLIYLRPGSESREFLAALRLHAERLDAERLVQMAERFESPKVLRAARRTAELLSSEQPGWVGL